MGDQRYTRYAEKKAGTNNKFYEVEAIEEDGRVRYFFRWGRIGTKGQQKDFRAASFAYAKSVCEDQFERKTKKGYREVTAMEALASAIEDPSERKSNGLPPLDLAIPYFGAGKSEERCRKFARKWLDKLNLVRSSHYDLGLTERGRQTDNILKGYVKEWRRIRNSKTHGANIGVAAEEAAEVFFLELRRGAADFTFISVVHFHEALR